MKANHGSAKKWKLTTYLEWITRSQFNPTVNSKPSRSSSRELSIDINRCMEKAIVNLRQSAWSSCRPQQGSTHSVTGFVALTAQRLIPRQHPPNTNYGQLEFTVWDKKLEYIKESINKEFLDLEITSTTFNEVLDNKKVILQGKDKRPLFTTSIRYQSKHIILVASMEMYNDSIEIGLPPIEGMLHYGWINEKQPVLDDFLTTTQLHQFSFQIQRTPLSQPLPCPSTNDRR